MYRYDEFDAKVVQDRVDQFRGQVERRIKGELTEDEFRPLRLMNGLYLQLHAYMLRVAIPYGQLNSRQMRMLAHIARKYDKGYGHFTTRQNIQYNWPRLDETPDILEDLASVEMHAIQTSGNCIRNVTSDQWAAATPEETEDPRPWCELLRQWSTFHPEFTYLPRKFKIAVTASPTDRAAIKFHDIGIQVKKSGNDTVFDIYVGGGLGRTPFIAKLIGEDITVDHLIPYMEAIMRTYNIIGRRDNMYKARIKILVHETGTEEFKRLVDEEFDKQLKEQDYTIVPKAEIDRIHTYFQPPEFDNCENIDFSSIDGEFKQWLDSNIAEHKQAGYAIVNISLKPIGGIPGDATDTQMEVIAELAEKYGHDEVRVTHEQNLVLPHIKQQDLKAVYDVLQEHNLHTANIAKISDAIACPGLDYCALANARSIPIAQEMSERFEDIKRQHNVGELKIKISGCINACGHHHVGHIGILGVNKRGKEFYQITLGGHAGHDASIGKILGPGFNGDEIIPAIEKVVDTYINIRENEDETFLTTVRRLGQTPFKEALYG